VPLTRREPGNSRDLAHDSAWRGVLVAHRRPMKCEALTSDRSTWAEFAGRRAPPHRAHPEAARGTLRRTSIVREAWFARRGLRGVVCEAWFARRRSRGVVREASCHWPRNVESRPGPQTRSACRGALLVRRPPDEYEDEKCVSQIVDGIYWTSGSRSLSSSGNSARDVQRTSVIRETSLV
jgi:hypothetical protein